MSKATLSVAKSGICVRPLEPSDCGAVCGMVLDNGVRFSEAGLAQLPKDRPEFSRWCPETLAASSLQSLKVIYGIVVTERGRESLAGFVGVETLNRFRGVGVWYAVSREYQSRGVAKTGVMAAMADFNERARNQKLAAPTTWILHAMPRNSRSIGLAESMGFAREEMLDYTRSTSSRGGVRFSGYLLERSGASLAAEAVARTRAFSMNAVVPMPEASNDSALPVRGRRHRA